MATLSEYETRSDTETHIGRINRVQCSPSCMRALFGIFRRRSTESGNSTSDVYRYSEFDNDERRTNGRVLGTFAGVFSPVALSMFSALLFLRVGFVVGNAGLLTTLGQFLIAYGLIFFTVSSVCAISSNGEVEGGGAYFMISRTLGPEFGGSIGTLFFFANIVSSALYIVGFSEGLISNFGPSGYLVGSRKQLIPGGHWWSFLYASCVNFTNLIISMIGAGMFAKTSVFVFGIVCVCTASSFFSFFHESFMTIPIPEANTLVQNATHQVFGNYTGFSWDTLRENLYSSYGQDYTSNGITVSFASVFGVLFSGVTGIMAGANMSGELKDPGQNIPQGTLSAVSFTMAVYVALSVISASTCGRFLLQNNYLYLMPINVWPPFITIGILTATISASLSNLIGSSRVIEALAKDNIYGQILAPIKYGTWRGNPLAAVFASWLLVQLMLLVGSLNTIAQINSILFLLSYFALNLACLGLELASAPNFRPTFKYFSWYTAILGLVGCFIMMFTINPFYASTSIGMCLIIVLTLHLFSPARTVTWGSISQALIFHQVRKYLLLLDSRKDHVKFWRPQILLLVANPRTCTPLIDFTNDVKKSGLYVIGHVKVGEELDLDNDPISEEYNDWLALIDHLKVKAFVELTAARSVREGARHLIRISGMGAMKPNTIMIGFRDEAPDLDFFSPPLIYQPNLNRLINKFPEKNIDSSMATEEYVRMIEDILKMGKNACVCRNFKNWNPSTISVCEYVDVWPINPLNPSDRDHFDTTSLFMLQLACIITMVPKLKHLKVRVFLLDESGYEFKALLNSLRIEASIFRAERWPRGSRSGDLFERSDNSYSTHLNAYLSAVNEAIRDKSPFLSTTAITFLYLPSPRSAIVHANTSDFHDHSKTELYLYCLTRITNELRPTILVHGRNIVTTTTL